jgi:predicted RNA binding protein YcfA (HicA-like mRNA interferase family)
MKVSEVLRMLHDDGWFLVATRGSHRQFKHPVKSGRVTVAGKPSDDFVNGNLKLIHNPVSRKPNIDTPPIRGIARSGRPFLPEGRHDAGLSFVA